MTITKKKPLFREARLRRLVDIIKTEQRVSTTELAERLDVTTATIRSDLAELEEHGLIQRGWGGAMVLGDNPMGGESVQALSLSTGFGERLATREAAKRAIGKAAAELVQDDTTIMVDAGTTTHWVLLNLVKRHRLNIVTNAAELPQPIVESPGLEFICTGGVLRRSSLGYIGELTEQAIQRFKASKTIVGMDGISLDFGLTTPNEAEARVKRAMIDSCKEIIVVADSSKLERVSLIPVAPAAAMTHLITDSGAPAETVNHLMQLGVHVIIVSLVTATYVSNVSNKD